MKPRYPIFIPSRGRVKIDFTAKAFRDFNVPYFMVVEPHEAEDYQEAHGQHELCTILVLPESNRGLVYSRNWIKRFSRELGAERHWQIDDNIRKFRQFYKRKRIVCDPGMAIRAVEDFTDRYTNVSVSGMNYTMFLPRATTPYVLNAHIYSCTLFRNADLFDFREPANEDVDMCLQVLAAGLCTIQFNAFMVDKIWTQVVKGGCTETMYEYRDVRLKNARALERRWPGVVTVERRFNRPHFVIANAWKLFDTPLIRRDDLDFDEIEKSTAYNLKLKRHKAEVKSPSLRALLEETE